MAVESATFDFEKAIEKAVKGLLETYFHSRYKLIKGSTYYKVKDRISDRVIYDSILLKSVAKTVTYSLVTEKTLYTYQLLSIDKKYQKALNEYQIAKHCNETKSSIHHRNKMEAHMEEMLQLKNALSLRIYLTVNPSASF